MEFDLFEVFRDRQITNSNTTHLCNDKNLIRVYKSRNLSNDGLSFIDINNYDSYIEKSIAKKTTCYKFLEKECFVTPNMTYNPRVGIKPINTLVNGSLAILIPKNDNLHFLTKDMLYISSEEYRKFYQIARNFQTRSLNIDNNSVFWFGKRKSDV